MRHPVDHLSWCPSHYMCARLVKTQSILLANIKSAPSNLVAYGVPSGNLTCEETDSWVNNTLRFPENSTLYSINGTDYAVPCSVINITLDVHCASPLVETDGHYCSFPCPLPSLSNSEYSNAQIMQDIVSWISWVMLVPLPCTTTTTTTTICKIFLVFC